ncbi:Predicted dehydrogenase [Palleronia marisminoris]|uniref:1,5-anhydro-D-fructose reductase n=1 Tax=Palleronia marisminoris TaxID=315423 RepID=A0A1Y5TNZ6_9RHOB|nr:Gfo/Idh/MocA family oxidoreductase [Palleronia marisminoris]SFH47338.1 Predicted dehydrogenase [Palleronia marisminoris]SLN68659.1 1,5-anhydro-D-fructose reductase [Palleronia marisminoris]
MSETSIGIIGCGVISGIYLRNIARLPGLALRAVADQRPAAAEAAATEHHVPALSVEALLARDDIDIVVNLTVPAAHSPVGRQVLEAGKHLYLEKPLAATLGEAQELAHLADARGLRIGCAPDTFLGGGHQAARAALDGGRIGRPIGGTATMMVAGHERWHPNPDFYYSAPGGGPLMDMGPYYLTALVHLLGPVREVASLSSRPRTVRRIAAGDRAGETVPVETDTHILGLLAFEGGALVQLAMSFDVQAHWHSPIEIYGTEGSMRVPDPNRFDGEVEFGDGAPLAAADRAHGADNWRGIGLADMAAAIGDDRPHRASGALALHVLETIDALQRAADAKRTITITSDCERPQPMTEELA